MDKTSPSKTSHQPPETDHPPPETVIARVIIRGVVQGVYFRVNTRDTAKRHSVCGWVRNNKDGSVEAVFEGRREDVEGALAWCREGPPGARVDDVQISWPGRIENFKGFHIDYESS